MISILVIDDSPIMAQFLSHYLKKRFEVNTCQSQDETLQLLESGYRPTLIVTDLQMPGQEYVSWISSLRKMCPYAPIVVVSGFKESKHRLNALQAGADDYVAKPFHPAELEMRIEKNLPQSALLEALKANPTAKNTADNGQKKSG